MNGAPRGFAGDGLCDLDAWFSRESQGCGNFQALAGVILAYLVAGHVAWRCESRARVRYPGRPSANGAALDEIEGFSRLAPAVAAWLAGGHSRVLAAPPAGEVDLAQLLVEGLCRGTNPSSKEYWGAITGPDQRVCEAADIALSVWLARDTIERLMSQEEFDRVFAWLAGSLRQDVKDNNWHLFPLLVSAVFRAFGREGLSAKQCRFHSERIRAMQAGGGWFRDGPKGPLDYYNSWGFHYGLYWLDCLGQPAGGAAYRDFAEPFFESFKWLFTPTGFPMYGRSVCYRMAAPAGLVTAALASSKPEQVGLAMRAVDCTWRHFIEKGALQQGRITAGYYHEDYRLMDGYSGAASPLWCLRSLIPLISMPHGSHSWSSAGALLPVESGDFSLHLDVPGWLVRGVFAQKCVELRCLDPAGRPVGPRRRGLRRMFALLRDRVTGGGFGRPLNELAYDQAIYSSARPFWERPWTWHA